jgi:nucleoside-diphosphate-sugar epimerase
LRFLVTGGAGFIGSHIVEALLRSKHQARVLDNFSTGNRQNLPGTHPDLEVIEGDVCDMDTVTRAMTGVEGAFHEAALVSVPKSVEHPEYSFEINAKGTFNVFEAARKAGVRRVVYASSAAVYGENFNLPLNETLIPHPVSPYGLDKLYGEQLGQLYSTLYGQEILPLRYFNVFGPRQDPRSPYSGVISIFADCLRSGKTPTIFGDGEQTRDFVYVGDVVAANLKAMFGAYRGFQIFNVACGRQTSLNQLFSEMQKVTQSTLTPTYAPARAGDILHSLADISAIQRELGYAPAVTLSEGLRLLMNASA